MDLRADRATECTLGALPWTGPRPSEPQRHHAGALQGATVTGEAGRPHLAVRIGLWLDDSGTVRQARWRASDDLGLRAAAEAACALLEARGARAPNASALREAGAAADGAQMVAAAVEAALALAGG